MKTKKTSKYSFPYQALLPGIKSLVLLPEIAFSTPAYSHFTIFIEISKNASYLLFWSSVPPKERNTTSFFLPKIEFLQLNTYLVLLIKFLFNAVTALLICSALLHFELSLCIYVYYYFLLITFIKNCYHTFIYIYI